MPRLRNGDVIECSVEKAVYRGLGLLRHGGQVIFVRNVYPGERWRVQITGVSKDYAYGVGVEPLVRIEARRSPSCPVFSDCGGCAHLDLDYAAQLRLKTAVLADVFARAGVDWRADVLMTPSPEVGWRSRASVHLERQGTTLRMGFKEAAGRRVVEPESCLQLSETMNAALSDLRQALASCAELTRESRRIEIVESYDGERRIATVVGGRIDMTRRRLLELKDRLHSVDVLGVVSEGDRRTHGTWSAAPQVFSRVRGSLFRTHARSFFQANRYLTDDLVRAVEKSVPAAAVVLDLYCGAGLFSVALASRARRVLGVEINPRAVNDARANAQASELTNVEFVRGEANQTYARLPLDDEETVVVDPPRGGLQRELVERFGERRPALIVYVSCDPPALARDLVRLQRVGYSLRSIDAFDLFPGTFHFETVACLTR
ncbi:MAG: class I SAM-dependent RNA methyltransferase [Vicinamibacteria bacterium]|nr:class I SAM-dependent RNA methyltransferase [Vicinamibacteria bacterium]